MYSYKNNNNVNQDIVFLWNIYIHIPQKAVSKRSWCPHECLFTEFSLVPKKLAINVVNYLSPVYDMHINQNSESLVTWSVYWDQRIGIFGFISSDTYFYMCHFSSYLLVSKTTEFMPRFKLSCASIWIIICGDNDSGQNQNSKVKNTNQEQNKHIHLKKIEVGSGGTENKHQLLTCHTPVCSLYLCVEQRTYMYEMTSMKTVDGPIVSSWLSIA